MSIFGNTSETERLKSLNDKQHETILSLQGKLRVEKLVYEDINKNYKRYKQEEIDNLNKEIKQHKQDYMKLSEKYQQLIDKYINLQKRKIK